MPLPPAGTARERPLRPQDVRLDHTDRAILRVLADDAAALSRRPEVLDVYFVAGANDFLLHVATASTDDLRAFVADHLNRAPAIAGTETNLIFEHTRAAGRRAV